MTTNDEYYNIEEMAEDMAYIQSFSEFDAYQSFTDETAIYPEEKALEYCALGLASEAGEFAGKVKKWIRDGVLDTEAAKAELSDVLWYVARCAEELEFYLSDVAKESVDKLSDRKKRGVIGGSGDYR